MADERAAYPDSSRRSEQLSYINFFHPSYELFYMIFQSFKDFQKFSRINNNSSWPSQHDWSNGEGVAHMA